MLLENMNQHRAPITRSRNAASCRAGAFDTSSDAPLLPILNADNAPLSEGAFKVKLPPTLTTTLLSYVMKRRIQEMCTDALFDQPLRSGNIDKSDPGSGFAFDIKSTPRKFNSNMVWISPANQATHNDLLKHLGSGGFGSVLEVLGSSLPNMLDSLTCYQLSFLAVSRCEKTLIHKDFSDMAYHAWNILIPLVLVDSPVSTLGDLVLQSDDKMEELYLKYEHGVGIVLGDNALHGTAIMEYNNQQYRLMASVYVAKITCHVVQYIIHDITQPFPGRKASLLLEWSSAPHWSRADGTKLQSLPIEQVAGKEWSLQLTKLKEYHLLHGHFSVGVTEDATLAKWVVDQHMWYRKMVAGGYCKAMTLERATLLKSIGFNFSST